MNMKIFNRDNYLQALVVFAAVTVSIKVNKSLFVSIVLPLLEVHFSMTFLFVHLLSDVIFVFNVLSSLVGTVTDEGINLLGFSEANTLVKHEFAHDVKSDATS